MTQLKARRQTGGQTAQAAAPSRLAQVFDEPVRSWQRLEAQPLDAAYYVSLAGGAEQVLWINQRAPAEPKIGRYVAATQLLPGFTAPLVRADTTLTRLEHPYLITGYLPTPTLHKVWPHLDDRARKDAATAWGAAVRLLHRIRFDLAGDLAYPEAEGARLEDDLEARWQEPLRLAVKDYMLDTPKLVAALKRGRKLLTGAPVTLCHGYPGPGSFLYDRGQPERPPKPRNPPQMVAALDFGDARRSDPMTDLAAIYPELEELGCVGAFLGGYGALSKWEKERLTFYKLHHELLRYALALTQLPNELALRRLRLADTLALEPTF